MVFFPIQQGETKYVDFPIQQQRQRQRHEHEHRPPDERFNNRAYYGLFLLLLLTQSVRCLNFIQADIFSIRMTLDNSHIMDQERKE